MTSIAGDADRVAAQSFNTACERFVRWLDQRVVAAGRGDEMDRLDVDPASTFWLGRLASEDEVRQNPLGDRAERLDPCAIGIRLRPVDSGPWSFTANVVLRAWVKEEKAESSDPEQPWRRSDRIAIPISVTLAPSDSETSAGRSSLEDELARVGAAGLSAEIRVERENWHGEPELVIQLINTSPVKVPGLKDTHLYETSLEISGLDTAPFILESLPDSFRYDRRIPAYGINVGVEEVPNRPNTFRTTDTVVVETHRPEYWNSTMPMPDLRFTHLAEHPIEPLRQLVTALGAYDDEHWSQRALDERGNTAGWSDEIRRHADQAAAEVFEELQRLEKGLALLESDDLLQRSFRLMNLAILHSAKGHGYDSWRPFQMGFLLQALPFLVNREPEADVVDTVWFATGGGKTETYLGLLVTAALHDRLTGKATGVTAWSRFPLRMLSMQQTQRFADALAGAELVRRAEGIKGAPISLGFYVGAAGTPNRIDVEAKDGSPDPDDETMPGRYQVLLTCPFCQRKGLRMRMDRRLWRLTHECPHSECPWPEQALPFYVVDTEIYRFLPTVIVGTLDKAASIGMQAAMRGLVGPPLGICDQPGHGYCYAPRNSFPHGCLVPDCPGKRRELPMPRERYAPSLRLQDELHLLRDSLGAVDSHYESILDYLQRELGAPTAKIAASSATLTGYERQVAVLYRRGARVFPQPGPRAEESFWSRTTPALLRRFVAIAPRGVTLEFVSDRTTNILQESVRMLLDPDRREEALKAANIHPSHVTGLLSMYGVDVIYGSTLYDVEAAQRSLDSNASVPINSQQLTGQTAFDDVRAALERLENPEVDFAERIHVIAASSMLSHGIDVRRLNVMMMLGLPLTTAEFIQTSARVGRSYPGLVHVLHKIGRERDAETFRHFASFIKQGDRFVEPIPVTRRSRRVLTLTMPGAVEARRLMLMEPLAPDQRLTTVERLRAFVNSSGASPTGEAESIASLLGFTGQTDELLREEIRLWLTTWFVNLEDPASSIKWPNLLGPTTPMTSLRDVEASAPIHD
jgi:Helicase conserved C-terminal domain